MGDGNAATLQAAPALKRNPMRHVRALGLLLLCLASPVRAADAPAVMRLTSLEWPPFVGSRLEQEGLSTVIASSAARKSGYLLQVDYFPWARAMRIGLRDTRYAGYFPAYYTEERARHCYFSEPIGTSTIGLAYLNSAPLQWQTLQDLSSLRIAVVAGFSNGASFDEMMRNGRLHVDASPSDMLNLRKLLAGRVDAVVIDKLVLRYLLLNESGLFKERARIAFHDKTLAELSLHVCFRKTPQGRALQQAFDDALHTLPLQRIESDYFRHLEGKAEHAALPIPP
jgi:polar amino acid transport system substrate-binding protein